MKNKFYTTFFTHTMRGVVLGLFSLLFVVSAQSQTLVDGDYRTAKVSGNWSDADMWETRTAGAWAVTATAPTASKNVYIQKGHGVTVDANAFCQDFQLDIGGTITVSNGMTLQVNRKIRAYDNPAVTGASDGVYTTSSISPAGITTTGTGKISFVYAGAITTSGEWGGAITGWNAEFAIPIGQTATLGTHFKAGTINIMSGTLSLSNELRPDGGSAGTGTLTVGATARVLFGGSSNSSIQRTNTQDANNHCSTVTIDGILEYSSTTFGVIGASTINFNGTVVYSNSGTLALITKGSNTNGATPNIYTNLTVFGGSTNTKTLSTITVNGKFTLASNSATTLSGTITYGANATLEYALNNTTARVIGVEWPATNGPKDVTLSSTLAICKVSISGGVTRTITGTLTLNAGTFAIVAANTLIMGDNSTIVRGNTTSLSNSGTLTFGLSVNVTINATISNSTELPSITPTATSSIGTLTIASGITYTITGGRTVTNIVNNGILAITPTTTMTLTIGGTISGAGTITSNLSTGNAVNYYSGSLSFGGTTPATVNMTSSFSRLRGLTVNNTGGVTLGNAITVDSSLTLTAGMLTTSGNLTVGSGVTITRTTGTLSAAPTFGATTANVTYSGSTAATPSFEMPTSGLKALTINNTGGLTLGSNTAVDTVKLTTGKITLGANNLTTAAITGGSSTAYVVTDGNGVLKRTNFIGSTLFPVGTSADYTPATVVNNATARDFSVKVGTTFASAPAVATKAVQLQWDITPSVGDASANSANLSFQWPSSANGTGTAFTTASPVEIAHHNGSIWDAFKLATATGTGTTVDPYMASATGFMAFSPFIVANQNALAVELTNFQVKSDKKSAFLTWTTASEKDNAYFDIQHATNGVDFQTIGQVKGNGTTTAATMYNFEHTTPSVSVNYYRLKQVDFNGTATLSAVRSVVFGKTGLVVKATLVTEMLDIVVNDTEMTPLSIFNLSGQNVMNLKAQGAQRVNVSALPVGMYIIRVGTGEAVRFVKQ